MNFALHRSALLLVSLALIVVISGAYITSIEIAGKQSESAIAPRVNESLHRDLGIALIAVTLGVAIWISSSQAPGWLQAVAWCSPVILLAGAWLGWRTLPLSATAAVFHALIAHLFLSLSVVFAIGTSAGWNREPERVDGSSRPLLRPLAVATPLVVFFQIVLGAAYRHDLTSVLPHIGFAMGVAFLALIGCTVVLQNFPRPAALRRSAAALITIVLVQASLGIAAFIMLAMNVAGNFYFVATTVGHVLVGASTLAASVVFAMQVWRSVLTKKRD